MAGLPPGVGIYRKSTLETTLSIKKKRKIQENMITVKKKKTDSRKREKRSRPRKRSRKQVRLKKKR